MEKWADYLISAVGYDLNKQRILKVKVSEDLGEKGSPPEIKERAWVISKLEDGREIITVRRNNKGELTRGEEVHILTVGNEKFIRTDRNHTDKDNLGELPEL